MLHCGGERSISYEVSELLVYLFDLCARRVAYPIDEPESVEAKTTVDELFGRHNWELPTLKAVHDNRAARFKRFNQLAHRRSTHRIEDEAKFLPVEPPQYPCVGYPRGGLRGHLPTAAPVRQLLPAGRHLAS